MQTFNDKNLWRRDKLRRVEEASDMVVDGLLDCLAIFDRLHLLIHEIKVVGPWVEGGHTVLLPAVPVQGMVVVEADHCGGVTDERVGVRVPALGRHRGATKDAGEPAHEGALAAPGVRRQANHHRLVDGA